MPAMGAVRVTTAPVPAMTPLSLLQLPLWSVELLCN